MPFLNLVGYILLYKIDIPLYIFYIITLSSCLFLLHEESTNQIDEVIAYDEHILQYLGGFCNSIHP